jgi:hypothetical protein
MCGGMATVRTPAAVLGPTDQRYPVGELLALLFHSGGAVEVAAWARPRAVRWPATTPAPVALARLVPRPDTGP